MGSEMCIRDSRYLVDAIKQVTDDPQRLDYIIRGLYLDIAKQYGTTGGKVEQAMRTAIRRCREKGGRGMHSLPCPSH